MSGNDQGYETAKWRTFWLIIGFAVLVGIGIATVLRPELEGEPNDSEAAKLEPDKEAETGEALQE